MFFTADNTEKNIIRPGFFLYHRYKKLVLTILYFFLEIISIFFSKIRNKIKKSTSNIVKQGSKIKFIMKGLKNS